MNASAKTEAEIRDEVRRFLAAELMPGENPEALGDTRLLISGGLLNSMSTVSLIGFLEDEYGVTFEAHEVSIDYLDDIAAIARTVTGKLAAKPQL